MTATNDDSSTTTIKRKATESAPDPNPEKKNGPTIIVMHLGGGGGAADDDDDDEEEEKCYDGTCRIRSHRHTTMEAIGWFMERGGTFEELTAHCAAGYSRCPHMNRPHSPGAKFCLLHTNTSDVGRVLPVPASIPAARRAEPWMLRQPLAYVCRNKACDGVLHIREVGQMWAAHLIEYGEELKCHTCITKATGIHATAYKDGMNCPVFDRCKPCMTSKPVAAAAAAAKPTDKKADD